jgi:hypothetical protein
MRPGRRQRSSLWGCCPTPNDTRWPLTCWGAGSVATRWRRSLRSQLACSISCRARSPPWASIGLYCRGSGPGAEREPWRRRSQQPWPSACCSRGRFSTSRAAHIEGDAAGAGRGLSGEWCPRWDVGRRGPSAVGERECARPGDVRADQLPVGRRARFCRDAGSFRPGTWQRHLGRARPGGHRAAWTGAACRPCRSGHRHGHLALTPHTPAGSAHQATSAMKGLRLRNDQARARESWDGRGRRLGVLVPAGVGGEPLLVRQPDDIG